MNRTVLVAGGGPTGLMLACELALAGVPVVVFERQEQPAARSAGMAVHGRTLDAFDRRGLADRIRPEDRFVWPRTPFALLWLNLATVDERDHTVAYPQWRTERLLAERAAELGVDLRRGHEIVGLDQDADGVTVEVRTAEGGYQATGAYLVGCDGAGSVVRELAGIGFPREGLPHHGMFADVPATAGLQDSFHAGLYPGGMAAAMPIGPQVLRLMTIELEVEPPAGDTPPTVDELRSMIGRVTGTAPDVPAADWVARFGGYTSLADRYREGRVFVAGDAAHVLFISGTQGLNAGVQDAMNLGWKLAAAVNGWAPADLLDSYHAERHPIGERICGHALATLMLLHQSTGRMGPLRELFAEFLQYDEVNRYLLQLPSAARYPLAAADDDHPLVGAPVPDTKLSTSDGETTLTATLRSGRGVLFDLTGGAAAVPDVSGWSDRIDLVHARPATDLGAEILLVRPDGHVAYAGPGDGDGLDGALRTWFGQPAAVGSGKMGDAAPAR